MALQDHCDFLGSVTMWMVAEIENTPMKRQSWEVGGGNPGVWHCDSEGGRDRRAQNKAIGLCTDHSPLSLPGSVTRQLEVHTSYPGSS